MIHVTQGHENSIGMEVFLKSFLLLSSKDQSLFTLYCSQETLTKHLDICKLTMKSIQNLKIKFIEGAIESTESLIKALASMKNKNDILLTLPTSKDQLVYKNKNYAGYTEFLRNYFKEPDTSMFFKSREKNILLVTDHIPLREVSEKVTARLIEEKVSKTILGNQKHFNEFNEVIMSGINPHAGEGGILGNEDNCINDAIISLKKAFPKIKFIGPIPGDTMHMLNKTSLNQLFVYMHHDQGLAPFKQEFGLIGLNISLGLPILRMSVDHGTAFSLYSKNRAHCLGSHYMLKSAIKVHRKRVGNQNEY